MNRDFKVMNRDFLRSLRMALSSGTLTFAYFTYRASSGGRRTKPDTHGERTEHSR